MPESTSQTGFLDIQGAPLYYEVTGQESQPALLLLHAGIADSRMWDELVPVFAQQYRVIRYDLRGFGQSQIPAGAFAYYEDPAELLKFLGVEQAHVIGVSFGSKVALDFALTHPEMVRSLVLAAPTVGGTQPSEDVQRFNEEEEALLEREDLEAASDLNVRFWVDGPKRTPEQVNPTVRQRVYDMQYHAFTVPIPEEAEEIDLQPPAITRLAELHVPTLIVVGDLDVLDEVTLAEQLVELITGAQLVVMPGVAHMLSMEQPGAFNRLVLDFLQTASK